MGTGLWSDEKIKKGLRFCKTKSAKKWRSMKRGSRIHGYCAKVHQEKKRISKRKGSKKSKKKSKKSRRKSRH